MRSSAEAICSRMARIGRSKPAMSVIVSMRASVSRGLLEWIGGERAVVARVHGLEHVERLTGAALAHHDAVGAHAQAVADEVADGDLALALDVRRPGLQRQHVLLVELELLGVLDGHDALVGGDERRQHVERGRLTGAGTAGDDHVEPTDDAGLQEAGRRGR